MNRNIVLPYQFDPEYTDEEMAERAKGTQSQRVADTDSSSEEEDSYDSWESFGDPYSDDEPFIYEGSDEELQGAVCYMQDPLFGTKPYQYEPTYKKGDKMPKEDPVIKQLKEKLTRERIVNSDWCTCGMCIVFKSPGECVCCQELKEVDSFREHGSCITEHEEFETVCLSQLNLRISYLESVNPYTDRKPREPDEGQIYRKYQELSYQRFKRWIYWRLPKDMIPIPSCVRYRIQEAFPSDEICGFRHVKHMIVFPIQGAIQSYAWGKIGSESLVAQLKNTGSSGFSLKNDQPYAELWMGTHQSGPAIIDCPSLEEFHGKPLEDWLKQNPAAVGKSQNSSAQLPFLLKVLSVQKALSIQAHPNKAHAEELHKLQPDLYKDPNHKPEMAVALTQFQALCGFRPVEELQEVFKKVPELGAVVGTQNVASFLGISANNTKKKMCLRKIFEELMSASPATCDVQILSLSSRLKLKEKREPHEELFLRISEEFPGDIGCLGLFLFNYLILEPGQAIYLAANEPHAYLKGDCVECMACSDNVVRAGLTPKHKDVQTLCSMLTYQTKTSQDNIFKGIEERANIVLFKPEVPDFCLAHIKLHSDVSIISVPKRSSASIVLVIKGEGSISTLNGKSNFDFCSGAIYFISAELEFQIKPNKNKELSIFQAFSMI